MVYGGAEEGAYLAQHSGIDEIHLTGSDRTYDQIVWGPPGPERDARKAGHAPLIAKPVSAELGNVSPVLVVPGRYSARELAFQAESIVGAVVMNASFLCNSPKMLITPKGWSGRAAFMAALERAFAQAPVRRAYYPGAEARWRELAGGRPQARTIGRRVPASCRGRSFPVWTPRIRVSGRSPRSPSARSSPRPKWEATIRWNSWSGLWISPTTGCGEPCRPTS